MGYMIEISDSKVEKMSEYVEDMLWAGGELMHCLEKMKGESGYGERGGQGYGRNGSRGGNRGGSYGNRYDEMEMRGGYGSRGSMGYRDEDDDWEEMGERRRRDSRGRYM
jgi:hypothetical protein